MCKIFKAFQKHVLDRTTTQTKYIMFILDLNLKSQTKYIMLIFDVSIIFLTWAGDSLALMSSLWCFRALVKVLQVTTKTATTKNKDNNNKDEVGTSSVT